MTPDERIAQLEQELRTYRIDHDAELRLHRDRLEGVRDALRFSFDEAVNGLRRDFWWEVFPRTLPPDERIQALVVAFTAWLDAIEARLARLETRHENKPRD